MENRRKMWSGNLVMPSEVIQDGLLVIEDGKIAFAGQRSDWKGSMDVPIIEYGEGWICPGFIDLHIHGIAGCEVMDGSEVSLQRMADALVSVGVTGFLATTLTADWGKLLHVVRTVAKQAGAQKLPASQLLGIHLEGPWINSGFRGAQSERYVAQPALSDAEKIVDAAAGWLRIVTMAPEMPHARDVIQFLLQHGAVISAGHTGATYEQISEAKEWGVSHVTHCFNAMLGLHHREPGTAGAAMAHEQLSVELIADGIHVHPAVMKILYKVKQKGHLILISDSMRATGLGEGKYLLGETEVDVKGEMARLPNGTLAGSILTLNRAVKNLVCLSGVPLHEAIYMASAAPASVIGLGNRKGKLMAGYDADFIVLDPHFIVKSTMISGVECFTRK